MTESGAYCEKGEGGKKRQGEEEIEMQLACEPLRILGKSHCVLRRRSRDAAVGLKPESKGFCRETRGRCRRVAFVPASNIVFIFLSADP